MLTPLQIPLTHRDLARSVHFVTGHASDGSVTAHNWQALVASGGTIVAYMASKTFMTVAGHLTAAGLPGSTPVVALENASRPDERSWRGTLASIGPLLAQAQPSGPTQRGVRAALAHHARVHVRPVSGVQRHEDGA